MAARTRRRDRTGVCRHCGLPMGWPAAVGVVFADLTAAHTACYERAEEEAHRRRQDALFASSADADADPDPFAEDPE